MIRFCAPFLFPAAIPALYLTLGPAAPLLAIVLLAGALLIAESVAPRGEWVPPNASPALYRLLPYAYVPVQLALIAWATVVASRAAAPLGLASLAVSVGLTTGIFGVLAAHELTHSPNRFEQEFGALMLTGMCYRHFRVAHIHGHHRHAGTPRDPGTARLGEGYYAFLARTVVAQLTEAFAFERRRTRTRWWRNRVVQDVAITASALMATTWLGGWRALAFLLLQSAVAVIVLELFNYVAHYGVARRVDMQGRVEPFADHHSWNSSNVVSNALLFNMGRHADHHRRATSPYQTLRYAPDAPELPGGYVGSILMALVPPLWRRAMDPKVRALAASDDLKAAA